MGCQRGPWRDQHHHQGRLRDPGHPRVRRGGEPRAKRRPAPGSGAPYDEPDGNEGFDFYERIQGGFRLDWEPTPDDHATLQGDLRDHTEGNRNALPHDLSGVLEPTDNNQKDIAGNVLARWSHVFSEDSDLSVQADFDKVKRPTVEDETDWRRTTLDLEAQHRLAFEAGIPQELIWGGSFRSIESNFIIASFKATSIPPGTRTRSRASSSRTRSPCGRTGSS